MDHDEIATCPYEPSHRVQRSRLQHHLVKCQKLHPKLWICPFNATHRFEEYLKEHHCDNCPDRPLDKPRPKAKAALKESVGAKTTPKPILQKEYIAENDPDCEYWD